MVVAHGCRTVDELAYGQRLIRTLPENEYFGGLARQKIVYYPTTTRDAFIHEGRLTSLISSGRLYADTGIEPLAPAGDRVMLCGSPPMLGDLRAMLDGMGFREGSGNDPGSYVIERAFVER